MISKPSAQTLGRQRHGKEGETYPLLPALLVPIECAACNNTSFLVGLLPWTLHPRQELALLRRGKKVSRSDRLSENPAIRTAPSHEDTTHPRHVRNPSAFHCRVNDDSTAKPIT